MEKISALIAARSGSVRVKNKNLRNFNNSSILELKIKQLLSIDEIDSVVVNSNCTEMLNLAKKLGAKTIKRDSFYASNEVSMSEVFKNMAEQMKSDYILYANCTNPLVKSKTYIAAIRKFFENMDHYDSLVSCHDVKEFLFLDGKALNYDTKNQPRSQDLPNIVALNFAISILSKKDMIKNKNIIGKNPYFYNLNEIESVDIDNPIDFFISEKLYEHLEIMRRVII
jgi:CMP-N,N'-diacetyllegionaminic acid synthase